MQLISMCVTYPDHLIPLDLVTHTPDLLSTLAKSCKSFDLLCEKFTFLLSWYRPYAYDVQKVALS